MIAKAGKAGLAAIPLALALACGCASQEERKGRKAESENQAPSSDFSEEPSFHSEKEALKGSGASLTQGRMTIFGLRIPSGMRPKKHVPGVYRFAGNNPVAQVATSIREQVTKARTTREGKGYLLRGARVREPQGAASGEELLAIRIAPGSERGALLDIWLEPEAAVKSNHLTAGAERRRLARKRRPARLQKAAVVRRREARRATWRAMRKISRGEPLSAEEQKSGFFD